MTAAVPKVSVCIPAYNHEKYVAECIESILEQSFQDFEIIVTDDASTDRTVEVILGFRDPRIRLFRHTANLGPSMAANSNMRAARGEYLAFLPSDDSFSPGKLEAQVAYLADNRAVAAVFGHVSIVDEHGQPLNEPENAYVRIARQPNRTRAQWMRYFFLHGNCLFGSTAMIRRKLVDEIGFHDPRLLQLQDLDYWIRICLRYDIHVIQAPMTRFRLRSGNANASADKPEVCARSLWEFHKILAHYSEIDQPHFFNEIFPELGDPTDARRRRLALGQLAAQGSYLGQQLFGLDLIYKVLGEAPAEEVGSPGLAYREFFRLTGSLDPYDVDILAKARSDAERFRPELRELRARSTVVHSDSAIELDRPGDDIRMTPAVDDNAQLPWTGERYVPELGGAIELEHLHRYTLAANLVRNRRVLDIASGEGYGSDLLARVARHVIGVDISEEAVAHARSKYRRPNLEFRIGSAADIPIPDSSVDAVVSFETIEHHDQHEKMLAEIKRILTSDGLLVISSPNKRHYSVVPNYSNPYHIKELFTDELKDLLGRFFANIEICGQRVVYGSLIVRQEARDLSFRSMTRLDEGAGLSRPLYDVAIASDVALPDFDSSVFEIPIDGVDGARYLTDRLASLQHMVTERDGQVANLSQTMSERDGRIAALTQALAERDSEIARLNQAAVERDGWIAALTQALAERDSEIARLNQAAVERDGQITTLNQAVARRVESSLRLESELKELQSKLTTIAGSNSWRLTLPLREARRWVNAPKAQCKHYAKAALGRLRRTYQALPLSPQTKALQRDWIWRRAPRVLLASGARTVSISTTSISVPIQPRLLRTKDGPSPSAAPVEGIVLPTIDSPVVSVIVPVCGRVDQTLRCLKSIEGHPPRVPFEVIVVDDCPPGESGEPLSTVVGARVITSSEELGFLRSCNAGARAAKGEYLLFLHNDSGVSPDWMDRLMRAFDPFPSGRRLKIAAVTMVYNEAFILPYFLSHYSYLDEIHVLYETDSTDHSLEILMQAPNVVIANGHIDGGLDDIEKIALINKALQKTKADWVYVVDPDEFVFPPNNESPHSFLKRQSCDVVRSGMFQVYRHRSDRNLDPSLPPVPQRIHGDPDLFSTDEEVNRASNQVYIKPNIVRPSNRIRFLPGHHQIEGNPQTSSELYVGAHWQMAEPSIAIARRMERKARVSVRNRAHQMGWQHYDVSVDKIKEECERHLDDPIIDALRSFSETAVQNSRSGSGSGDVLGDSMTTLKDLTSPASGTIARVPQNGENMYKFDPLEHSICLSAPRRTVPFQSWRQHVPFAMLLVDVLKPRTLVELGVHYGDSYCAFCQAVADLRLKTSCYGVDTWKGDPHASFYGSEVLGDLAAHHNPLYGGFSHLIQSTFDDALQHFPDGAIDILHIDGYHTYKAVKHDFESWLPKVSPRGVILLHDIHVKERDFGVWRLWDEVKVRYPHFEFLHSYGLGLVAVGERPPEELSWLFEANDEKAAVIRNFFFCLGDRLTDKMRLSASQESATAGGPELEALRTAKSELDAIRSSTTWRVAKKVHFLIDAMRPSGRRRRES